MKRLHPVYAQTMIEARIAAIESEPAYRTPNASVEVNAPLALMQVEFKTERRALLWALSLLTGPKKVVV